MLSFPVSREGGPFKPAFGKGRGYKSQPLELLILSVARYFYGDGNKTELMQAAQKLIL
jgi:hypothetical protein